jgi:hypothetical protein
MQWFYALLSALGITGLLGGFNVSILPLLYPAGVRASGFNIGACMLSNACIDRR